MYPRARIEISSDSRRAVGLRWRILDPGCQALLVLAHRPNGDTRSRLAAAGSVSAPPAWRHVREVIDLLAAAGLAVGCSSRPTPTGRSHERCSYDTAPATPGHATVPPGWGRRPQLAATLIDVAVAALMISIIAVLLTGAGLVYAHQQASAAKSQARLLKDQQLDLRTPVFEPEIEDRGSWHRLVVRLTSQWPLVAIRVTLLGDNNLQFSDSQNGVQPGTPAPRKTATWNNNHPEQGGLHPGDTAVWRIDLGDEQRQDTRPEQLSLRIECAGGTDEERWTVHTVVAVPEDPRKSEIHSF